MTTGSEAAISATLRECLERECAVLAGYVRTIDGLIAVTIGDATAALIRTETAALPDACVPVLSMMLQAAGSSSHTLLRLSDAPGLHTRDCYSIARSIVEVATNICYVMAEGTAVAERAMRHARQKAFKDLSRESRIGGGVIKLTFAEPIDPSSADGLEADIAEFTSRGQREKGWVDSSIDDRIEAVGRLNKKAMTALHWARFAIYRHSSEILHGTFFSALFFFGQTAPDREPRSVGELSESFGQQHMMLLMAAILALSAVTESFHSAYGFAAANARSAALMEELRTIPMFQTPQ